MVTPYRSQGSACGKQFHVEQQSSKWQVLVQLNWTKCENSVAMLAVQPL